HPIFVERVRELRVERRAEDLEVRVPLRAAEEDDVVRVHRAYASDDSLVEGFELRVEVRGVEEVRYRLVEQVITGDSRLVFITRGELLPETHGQLLTLLALEEEGITEAVVYVVARLPAR